MPCVLITGAKRGLGLEFARQYLADAWRVIAAFRDPLRANALPDRTECHALDVTDILSIGKLVTAPGLTSTVQ